MPLMFERWIALFYPVDNAIGFFTSYPVDSANTFEQPGPGARSGRCYRRRVLRLTGGGGGGEGAVRVEGGLSLFTGCFLNCPKKWS